MAAPSVYTRLFYATPGDAEGFAEAVPVGSVWIVRYASVAGSFELPGEGIARFFGADGACFWQVDVAGHALSYAQWEGRVVIPEASTLAVSVSNPLNIYVCGYEFFT